MGKYSLRISRRETKSRCQTGPNTLRPDGKRSSPHTTTTGFMSVLPPSLTSSTCARRSVSTVSASTTVTEQDTEPSQSTPAEQLVRTSVSASCSLRKQASSEPPNSTLPKAPPSPWVRLSPRRVSWTWTESPLRPCRRRRSEHYAVRHSNVPVELLNPF